MRRHPTCGRKVRQLDVEAKVPPGAVLQPRVDNFVRLTPDAVMHALRSFGCDMVPHPTMSRVNLFRCQICGPRGIGQSCEADKHDAYYEALEKGEREPIEWEGDIRVREELR